MENPADAKMVYDHMRELIRNKQRYQHLDLDMDERKPFKWGQLVTEPVYQD